MLSFARKATLGSSCSPLPPCPRWTRFSRPGSSFFRRLDEGLESLDASISPPHVSAPASSTPSLSCCSGVYTAAAKPLAARLAPCGGSSSPRVQAGPLALQATPAGEKMPSWPAAARAAASAKEDSRGSREVGPCDESDSLPSMATCLSSIAKLDGYKSPATLSTHALMVVHLTENNGHDTEPLGTLTASPRHTIVYNTSLRCSRTLDVPVSVSCPARAAAAKRAGATVRWEVLWLLLPSDHHSWFGSSLVRLRLDMLW